jgi:hypothetical protein
VARVAAVDVEQVAELAALISRDHSPAASAPGIAEPTVVEAASGDVSARERRRRSG